MITENRPLIVWIWRGNCKGTTVTFLKWLIRCGRRRCKNKKASQMFELYKTLFLPVWWKMLYNSLEHCRKSGMEAPLGLWGEKTPFFKCCHLSNFLSYGIFCGSNQQNCDQQCGDFASFFFITFWQVVFKQVSLSYSLTAMSISLLRRIGLPLREASLRWSWHHKEACCNMALEWTAWPFIYLHPHMD